MSIHTSNFKSWVQKTPGVCGGDACLRDTRITVWGLVLGRRLGASDARLLENIVGLTPDELKAAWDYYREHPEEIDMRSGRMKSPEPWHACTQMRTSFSVRLLSCTHSVTT